MDFIKRNRKKSTLQYIARITELLETNGEITITELRRAVGITSSRYNAIITYVTQAIPVYESDDGKLGLMHRGNMYICDNCGHEFTRPRYQDYSQDDDRQTTHCPVCGSEYYSESEGEEYENGSNE